MHIQREDELRQSDLKAVYLLLPNSCNRYSAFRCDCTQHPEVVVGLCTLCCRQ